MMDHNILDPQDSSTFHQNSFARHMYCVDMKTNLFLMTMKRKQNIVYNILKCDVRLF